MSNDFIKLIPAELIPKNLKRDLEDSISNGWQVTHYNIEDKETAYSVVYILEHKDWQAPQLNMAWIRK